MKVLASFPQLVAKGGSERVLEVMSKNFDLTIITNKYDPENTFSAFKDVKIIETKKINKFFYGMKLARTKFKKYDVFHSHGYFINNFLSIKNHPTLFYCITPKRDIYKLRQFYLNKLNNPISKLLKNAYLNTLKKIDQYLVKNKIDGIVSISEEVRKEVNKIYGKDCGVVYPPTMTQNYRYNKTGDYYLCVSRITHVKRIDMIVEAFNKTPDKKLIIAGSTPEKEYFERIKNIANKNIEFRTNISDNELVELYANCICTIYLPIREDFSLTAVEALSSGKPTILANEGALPEIIENEKQGILIEPTIKNIINAVNKLTPEKCKSMKNICMKRSLLFGEKQFTKTLTTTYKNIIENNIKKRI
jgi:glycosyltransferase involved in cell wall biosynthesis